MRSQHLRPFVRKWFWFILGGTLVGAFVALGLAVVKPPGYTAHVTLLVSPTANATGITSGDLQLAQALTPTFAELATTTPVLKRVIASADVDTDPEGLSKAVTTHVPVGTTLLTISVSNPDAEGASKLANAIASELRAYARPGGSDASVGLPVELTVVDPATPPITRAGPGPLVGIALGGVIGLLLAISIAFLVENVFPQSRDPAG